MSPPNAEATPGEVSEPGSARLPVGRIGVGLAALVAIVVLGRSAAGAIQPFAVWVNDLGMLGPLVFIGAYALAVVAFVPASILSLGAGAIFGIAAGTAYVFVAATLGASAAFVIARYFARSAIEQKLAGNPKFSAIDRGVGNEGRKIVFLLRLSPAFPFNLLNYGLGLTSVRFVDYLVASIGMLPGTLLYVYSGKLVGDVASLAGDAPIERGLGDYAVLGLGFVATLLVVVLVTRTARRALAEATENSST